MNPEFGEVGSQFHAKDEKEMIPNPQNERERCFSGKHMMEEFWLDWGKQCTTIDEHLLVMKTEFQKKRSNLINHFTEKTKGDNAGCHILELPHVKSTGNINKHQKHSFESHMRHSNPTKINHRTGVIQDKSIG